MNQRTLFEAIGGFEAVLRLAHAWHERVLADDIVAHAFSHGFHPHHTERLAAYWCEAWGGPARYTEQLGSESMVVRMHSGNGEHAEMDRRAIRCFEIALVDAQINDPALKQVLLDYFTWTTHHRMASYPESKSQVPERMSIARWSWSGLQESEPL